MATLYNCLNKIVTNGEVTFCENLTNKDIEFLKNIGYTVRLSGTENNIIFAVKSNNSEQ